MRAVSKDRVREVHAKMGAFVHRPGLRSVVAIVLGGTGLLLVVGGWLSGWLQPRPAVPLLPVAGFMVMMGAVLSLPTSTRPLRVRQIAAGGSALVAAAALVAGASGMGALAWLIDGAALGWADPAERLAAMRWTAALPMSWAGILVAGFLLGRVRRYVALGAPAPQANGQPAPADVQLGQDAEGYPIKLLEEDRYMHVLVAGPTGTGKTRSTLAPMLVQDLANPRVGLTVIEPKGDFVLGDFSQPGIVQWAEHYGRTIRVIDPANPRTDVFNPLIGDRHMVAEVNSVGLRTLFGDEVNFFTIAQEALFKKTLYLLKWLRGDHLTYWDLQRTVRDFKTLTTYSRELRGRMEYWKRAGLPPTISLDDLEEIEDLVNWFRVEASGDSGDKLKEVTLGLRVQLDNLMNNAYFRRCIVPGEEAADPTTPGGRIIDLDKHLANGSVLAVSTNDGLLAGYSSVLGRMLVTAFQYAASRRFTQPPDQRGPHVICIDESPTYLSPAWAEFQSKARGFQIGIVLGAQTLSQFDRIERGFTDTIVGQCRTRVIYGGLPPKDIQYWLDAFGTKKEEEVTWTESRRNLPVGAYFDLLGPIGYHQVTSGKNTRLADRTRVEFNELWELPRGRVVIQRMVRGNVEPPGIATVSMVTTLPPKIGTDHPIPAEAGLATLKDPILPALPPGVELPNPEHTKPDSSREKGRGGAGRTKQTGSPQPSRKRGGPDASTQRPAPQKEAPSPSSRQPRTEGRGLSVMEVLVGKPQGERSEPPTAAAKRVEPSPQSAAADTSFSPAPAEGRPVASPADAEAAAPAAEEAVSAVQAEGAGDGRQWESPAEEEAATPEQSAEGRPAGLPAEAGKGHASQGGREEAQGEAEVQARLEIGDPVRSGESDPTPEGSDVHGEAGDRKG